MNQDKEKCDCYKFKNQVCDICQYNQEQWEKIIDTFLHQLYEIAKPTKENIGFFVSWEHNLKETILSLLQSEREKLLAEILANAETLGTAKEIRHLIKDYILKDN